MNVKHGCQGAILCMFHDKSMHRNPIFFTQKEFYCYFQTKRLVPGLASAKKTIYGKSRHFVYVHALIMCKSTDAVLASYHWAVLHTLVDTRAMYYVSSLLPFFVSRTFHYGRGERQDWEKKDCKGDRVGVFQWLTRLACLAHMARMACMARTFGSLARTLAILLIAKDKC